jgi:hypothetical protein
MYCSDQRSLANSNFSGHLQRWQTVETSTNDELFRLPRSTGKPFSLIRPCQAILDCRQRAMRSSTEQG